MKTKTIAEVTVMLQKLANQVGSKRYEVAKALILNDLIIVDADGSPVDPSTIQYEVTLSEDTTTEADAETAGAAAKSIAAEVAKAVRLEFALARAANPPKVVKTVSVSGGAKIYGKLKGFTNHEDAFRFGSWAFACLGMAKSKSWCAENGIVIKAANSEGSNLAGGFLVPDEFENSIITLRDTFGVARQNCRVVPMKSDTKPMPRRATYAEAFFVGEGSAGTESNDTFDMITLVAKKTMCLPKTSNELMEDAAVNFGDDLAVAMAYAQTKIEDRCLFIGDSTSSFGGITGLATAVGSAGVSTATGSAFGSITIEQITDMMGLLPQYADEAKTSNTKFYMNKTVWTKTFLRLAAAAGGNTHRDLLNASKEKSFLGYEVVLSSAMNATTGSGKIACHFGDMSQGVYLGDRRQTTVDFSNSALNAFEKDQIVFRSTSRWDLNCSNVGDTTSAGSIVTLKAGA